MNVLAVRKTASGQPGPELSAATSLCLVGLLLLAGALWALLEAASRLF